MKDNILKIKKLLGKLNIKNDQKFNNLEDWDSLTHMKFIFNLEKEFKLKFNINDILKIKDINSCLKIIRKNAIKKK